MSQNGADALSDNGVHYSDILKFFYGGDIQLSVARQQPGQTPFGVKPLATFERNDETFTRGLTFAGQTRNLGGGTGVERTGERATTAGGSSQKLTFDYDAARTSPTAASTASFRVTSRARRAPSGSPT